MTLPTTTRVPEAPPARPVDTEVVIELLENARDNIAYDVLTVVGLPLLAGVAAGVVAGDAQTGVMFGAFAVLPSLVAMLKLAIRRRRRRCWQLGVDPVEVDRLFRRVDIFKYVFGYDRLSDDVKRELAERIVRGGFI